MSKKRAKSLLLSLTAILIIGCGNSFEDPVVANNVSTSQSPLYDPTLSPIEQATLNNPGPALETVPTGHLDPLTVPKNQVDPLISPQGDAVTLISVADLESDFETIFCSLSKELNVTKTTQECVDNVSFIKSQPGTGFFDLDAQPILNNPLGVSGVSFQSLEYDTTVPLPSGDQTFHVSGGLLMPQGINASQVKGVVVYFHGTTFNKANVGSSYENSSETRLNAQVFASQGYVVVIPDYVGQGVDWQTVHPYVLYPKASAQTAVDMLSAVKAKIVSQYAMPETQAPLKLFSAGYSEGGSYSLWFNSYIKGNPSVLDPFYQLTHSVGMEGAYSTSEVIFGYLFEEVSKQQGNPFQIQSLSLVNFVKPILSADAFLSYATYSDNSAIDNIFNPDFFQMNATPPIPQALVDVGGQHLSIDQAFAMPNTGIGGQLALAGLGKMANGASYPGPFAVFTSSANSVRSLVSSVLLTSEPLADLLEVLAEADADLSNVDVGGVSIITLDQDSVVSPNNYDVLLDKFPTKIRTAIKIDHTQLKVTSPYSLATGEAQWKAIDHLNAPPYEYLYALNIFNQF